MSIIWLYDFKAITQYSYNEDDERKNVKINYFQFGFDQCGRSKASARKM